MPENIENENRFVGDRWALDSRLELVDGVADAIEERLRGLGWTDEDLGIFLVAAREALANAIIYGNLGVKWRESEDAAEHDRRIAAAEKDPELTGKKVRVELEVNENEANVAVLDEGSWSDVESIPDPKTGERLFLPHGRGVEIMRGACDEVRFLPGKVVLYKRKRIK